MYPTVTAGSGPLKIAIIDDDAILSNEVAEYVAAGGNSPSQVTPADFVSRPAGLREDLLILDIHMPGVDGLDVIEKAAASGKPPAIVLMSGHGEEVLRGASAAAESRGLVVVGSLAKPFTLEELTRLISSLDKATFEAPAATAGDEAIRSAVATAVACNSLAVAFQPVIRADDFCFSGAEALLQGVLPGLPALPPPAILRAVEADPALLEALSWAVAEQAADACRKWTGLGHDGIVAVNIPARVLRESGAVDRLLQIAAAAGVSPASMAVELLEEDAYDGEASSLAALVRLRLAGFRLLLDDVGRRESGLMQLSALPVTGIKIDRDLIQAARRWDKARRIYAAVAELGAELGLTVTAEGVETAEDARFVRDLGVSFIQGFLVSGKLTLPELLAIIPSLSPSSLRG